MHLIIYRPMLVAGHPDDPLYLCRPSVAWDPPHVGVVLRYRPDANGSVGLTGLVRRVIATLPCPSVVLEEELYPTRESRSHAMAISQQLGWTASAAPHAVSEASED